MDETCHEEEPQHGEKGAEEPIDRVRALARDELGAHDDALRPHLKPHHQIRPDHTEPSEHQQPKPDDCCNHPPILHPHRKFR